VKKILIVSPHFPPVNAADMQRTRLALPYLRAMGWEATVLAVTPESVEGAVIDNLLLSTYPPDTEVIRVQGIPARLTRWAGIGSLWWRCGRALRAAGNRILQRDKFDLVFFSTTQFDAFTLGPYWLKKFGIPYVLDYQDPWVNDYYRETGNRPPGGGLKFWVSQLNARRHEPVVLAAASGVMAVSSSYGPNLHRRYHWFSADKAKTIPFGTSALDLDIAREHEPKDSLVPFGDGKIHHVYAGRCGPDMTIALTILFRAFRRYCDTHPESAAQHHFHFIGTDYAPPPLGRYWALPVAAAENVREYVTEQCYRIPYFDALHYLTRADALIVVGSDDPSYNASKLAPYILAQRPLIAITHELSPMVAQLRECGLTSYHFTTRAEIDKLVEQVHANWFVAGQYQIFPSANHNAAIHDTAATMTEHMVAVFRQATATHNDSKPI
jgi:hypothetical protein